MLSNCRAYVVAQTAPQNRSLLHLAERVGFGFIGTVFGEHAVSVSAVEPGLAFFLIHHLVPDSAMTAMMSRIRGNENGLLRYAPILLVVRDCPPETVIKYVRMGYNDVLTLPQKREEIIARLLAQLTGEHLYIETESYFGPDRRRLDLDGNASDARFRPGSPHMRIFITRSVRNGVQVVRRQIVGRAAPARAVRSQVMNAARAAAMPQVLGRSS